MFEDLPSWQLTFISCSHSQCPTLPESSKPLSHTVDVWDLIDVKYNSFFALCSHISSAGVKSDLSSGQKRLLGHRYTSSHPENCFYPLPPSSQLPQQLPDRHNIDYHQYHIGQGASSTNVQASTTSLHPQEPLPDNFKPRLIVRDWTKAWPDPEEAGASFWSSGAAEEEGAASGNSSEVQEDSTPSAYDNLDRVSSCQKMEDDTTGHFEVCDPVGHIGTCEEDGTQREEGHTRPSSSSWSSCEVLPLDENNAEGDASSDMSPNTLKRLSLDQEREEENIGNDDPADSKDNDVDNDNSIHHPNSLASCSVLSGSPLSTGSSEVFLPSGPSDTRRSEPLSQPRDAQSLLAELQQQMLKQKTEYQATIQRWDLRTRGEIRKSYPYYY